MTQKPVNWPALKEQLKKVEHPERWAACLFLLTPVNWGLEALKWQILLWRVNPIPFWAAYKGVLAGVSLGFALPAQLGDTAGRVMSLERNRAGAIGASLMSGGMQFYVAIIFGTLAWLYHLMEVPERKTQSGMLLLGVLLGLSLAGVLLGATRQRVISFLASRSFGKRVSQYIRVAGEYTDREISLALGAAAVRYLIFSGQFYIAMQVVGLDIPPVRAFAGIGLVFLAKTITPAFNLLSDLGVREAASLWVFSPYGVEVSVVLTATLLLWFANVLTPVLVGLIWVYKLKLTA
ncbi:lysylphosphatidylglycerol synthase domain-containing protein [Spirosoma aerophilum]